MYILLKINFGKIVFEGPDSNIVTCGMCRLVPKLADSAILNKECPPHPREINDCQ